MGRRLVFAWDPAVGVPQEMSVIAASRFDDAGSEVEKGFRGAPEERPLWVESHAAALRRCPTAAEGDAMQQRLFGAAERMVGLPDITGAGSIVAVLSEVSSNPVIFKDCADLLWRCADRGLTFSAVPAIAAPFARLLQRGPADSFTAVVERVVKTFEADSPDASHPRKILAAHFIDSLARHQSNLFVAKMSVFFSGVWAVAKELLEQDNSRGAPALFTAFSFAVDVLRPMQQNCEPVVAGLHAKLRMWLGSRRDAEVLVALRLLPSVLRLRRHTSTPAYADLWAMLWGLRDRGDVRWAAMGGVLALARSDPASFTTDRRSKRELEDMCTKKKDHRKIVLDFIEELWKQDTTQATASHVINFFAGLLEIEFPEGSRFSSHDVDDYFLSSIRFKLLSTKATKREGGLVGCWDILPLLATICRMFKDNTTMIDAYVAPCVLRILGWGEVSGELAATLPTIVGTFSPTSADKACGLLLGLVASTLGSTRSWGSNSTPPPMGRGAQADVLTALDTLENFEALADSELLGDFVVQVLLPLMSHDAPEVRRRVAGVVGLLAVPKALRQQGGQQGGGEGGEDHREQLTSQRGAVVDHCLGSLLGAVAVDSDPTVRRACLDTVRLRLLRFVDDPALFQFLFNALSDADVKVRCRALECLCLLEHKDPVRVTPALRRRLVGLLGLMTDVDIRRADLQDTRVVLELLRVLLHYSSRLVVLYAHSILKTLVEIQTILRAFPQHPDVPVTYLRCLSGLLSSTGFDLPVAPLEEFFRELLPLAPDATSPDLQHQALLTLGDLLEHTRIGTLSASALRDFDRTLIGIIKDGTLCTDTRAAALRVLGIVGAVDPVVVRQLSVAHHEPAVGTGTAGFAASRVRADDQRSCCRVMFRAMSEVAVAAMGTAQLESVFRSQLRSLILIMDGCPDADAEIAEFVPACLAAVRELGAPTAGQGMSDLCLVAFYQLVRAVAIAVAQDGAVLPVADLYSLAGAAWETGVLRDRLAALRLCTEIVAVPAGQQAFAPHFRDLFPRVFGPALPAAETEPLLSAAIELALHCPSHVPPFLFHVSRCAVRELMRPAANPALLVSFVKLFWQYATDGVAVAECASLLVRPLVALLSRDVPAAATTVAAELHRAIFGLLASLAVLIGPDFAPFANLVPRALLQQERSDVQLYRRAWHAVASGLSPATADVGIPPPQRQAFRHDLLRCNHERLRATLRWGGYEGDTLAPPRNAAEMALTATRLEPTGERAVLEVVRSMTADTAWLQQFIATVFEHSPYSIFRCVADVRGEQAAPLVRKVFLAAFRCLWVHCTDELRKRVATCFSDLLSSADLPDDMVPTLLTLVEFMDIIGAPLSIEPFVLSTVAFQHDATAKALRWQEECFRFTTADDAIRTPADTTGTTEPLTPGVATSPVRPLPPLTDDPDSPAASSRPRASVSRASVSRASVSRASVGSASTMADAALQVATDAETAALQQERTEALTRRAEDLIMMYGRLHSSVSAVGLLNAIGLPADAKRILMEESLINLGRFEEALALQQHKKHRGHAPSFHRARGKSFNDDSFAALPTSALCDQASRVKCQYMLGQLELVLQATLPAGNADDDEPCRDIVRHVADAALALQRWDLVGKALASPYMGRDTPQSHLLSGALAFHRQDYAGTRRAAWLGLRSLVPDAAGLLAESYERAYDTIVAAQQLVELDEAAQLRLMADDGRRTARDSALRQVWDHRLRGVSEDPLQWRRLLQVRKLLVAPASDKETYLALAALCRRRRETLQERAALLEVVRCPTPQDLQRGHLPCDMALAYAEHLMHATAMSPGEEASLLEAMTTAYSEQADCPQGHLARLWLLRAQGLDETAPSLDCAQRALDLDGTNTAAWRHWASLQVQRLEHGYDSDALRCAIEGRVRCVTQAESPALVVEDVLALVSLWSEFAEAPGAVGLLERGFGEVPPSAWLLVVPQLVAKIDFGSDGNAASRELACATLQRVFESHPDGVIFPVLLSAQGEGRRGELSSGLLATLGAARPLLVDQGRRFSRELCRVAKEPWVVTIVAAWELYTKFCEGDRSLGRAIVRCLEPLHDGGRTAGELAEQRFYQSNGLLLRQAQRHIALFAKHERSAEADLHAAFRIYEAIFRNPANKVGGPTLSLQVWSRWLWEARDLELGIPRISTTLAGRSLVADDPAPSPCIARMDHSVGVIGSKQAPRKVTVLGSDGSRAAFLLKGGEDLRLDERVMQLFGLVNTLLAGAHDDKVLRELNVQRYSVTPLSDAVGLCGWVPECDTLHELVTRYREHAGVLPAPALEFVLRGHLVPGDPTSGAFNNDCARLPVMAQVEVFDYVCGCTSGEDLRRAFWTSADNSEDWLSRRTMYMQSLAATSIVGYVLGLGDRHVTNIMVQRSTGKVVHIDFGDCFEVAMNRAALPEKVPFRLTRMLRRAMDVAEIEGHYRSTAEHVVTVLRDSHGSVMAMLQAFVDDPLVSWRLSRDRATMDVDPAAPAGLDGAGDACLDVADDDDGPSDGESESAESAGSDSAASVSAEWRAEAPATITEEGRRVMRRIRSKLRGRDFDGPRLDVREQVDRLVDSATCVENLAQAWVGWHPWW